MRVLDDDEECVSVSCQGSMEEQERAIEQRTASPPCWGRAIKKTKKAGGSNQRRCWRQGRCKREKKRSSQGRIHAMGLDMVCVSACATVGLLPKPKPTKRQNREKADDCARAFRSLLIRTLDGLLVFLLSVKTKKPRTERKKTCFARFAISSPRLRSALHIITTTHDL